MSSASFTRTVSASVAGPNFAAMSRVVRETGLLRRSRWFYAVLLGALFAGLGGAITGFVLLGDSWFQLLIAGALGLIFTQFAFFSHEAAHRQVLASGPANDRLGRIIGTAMAGMSYQWWMTKHTRYHANPNMGATFAPNHIGMAFVARDAKLDFLSKQVLTSRNITGGWWMTILMGGLNHQVEHHLFPNMPRPHLARAREIVREHCLQHDVPYTETSLPAAWKRVIRHLNVVGRAAPRIFECPVALRYSGS
jgi:fatty acid desaturase